MQWKRNIFLWCAALCLGIPGVMAQGTSGSRPLETIPFLFDGHQVLIPVSVNGGEDTLHFLFDSGCEVNVLSSRTMARIQLNGKGEAGISGWRKEMTMVPQAHANSLEVGKLSFPYPDFYVQDLGKATFQGIPVDGVIGYTLLQRYVVELNFHDKIMRLYRSGNFHYPGGGEKLSLGLNYKTPVVEASMVTRDAQTLSSTWHVITGGNFGLLLNGDYVKKHQLANVLTATGTVSRPDLLQPVTYTQCTIPAFTLGSNRLTSVAALYSAQVNDTAPDKEIAGAIGATVWQQYTLFINLPGKALYLIREKPAPP